MKKEIKNQYMAHITQCSVCGKIGPDGDCSECRRAVLEDILHEIQQCLKNGTDPFAVQEIRVAFKDRKFESLETFLNKQTERSLQDLQKAIRDNPVLNAMGRSWGEETPSFPFFERDRKTVS